MKRERAKDSRGRVVPGVYIQENGRFVAGYKLDGKWSMKTLDAKDLTAARRERESLISGLREGRIASRNDATVEETFIDWQASRKIAERTKDHEQHLLDRHLSKIVGKRVQDVSTSEIAAVVKMDGYSEWTRTAVHRLARGVFAHALRRGLVTRNPCDGLSRSEVPTQKNARAIHVLDAVEVASLIEAAATTRWRVGLGLMALAGLRMGEMRGLRWADVSDLSVRVSRSVSPGGDVLPTKTAAGVRDVPLTPALHKLLTAWRLESPRSMDEDLIVGTASGKPLGETAVRKALSAAVTGAKVEGDGRLSCHSLRHSYASRLGLAGLNPTTLARILGHTDSSFTLRTYCSDQRSVEDVAADVLRASAV